MLSYSTYLRIYIRYSLHRGIIICVIEVSTKENLLKAYVPHPQSLLSAVIVRCLVILAILVGMLGGDVRHSDFAARLGVSRLTIVCSRTLQSK